MGADPAVARKLRRRLSPSEKYERGCQLRPDRSPPAAGSYRSDRAAWRTCYWLDPRWLAGALLDDLH